MHNARPVRFTEVRLEGVHRCPVKTLGLFSRPPFGGHREACQLRRAPALAFSASFQATCSFAVCRT